jgi:hypothetical protein
MKTIAIIDDKEASLKSFKRQITNALERLYPEWKVIARKPFLDISEYPQWVIENEISVLILDEQLDGEAVVDGKNAEYSGHDLVKELRKRFKDLPVYSISSYAVSEDLKKSLSYFNLILSTGDFDNDNDTDNYINLFVRSGINFYNEYQKELGRLGELSTKIAIGEATHEDLEEITSLQTRLLIPHITAGLENREVYLNELGKKIDEIKTLQGKLLDLKSKK